MSCFKPCTDHKGNTFKSVAEKCRYWSISVAAYNNRKIKGWPEKEALETKIIEKCKPCTDHKGNVFNSEKEMCDYWGISASAYQYRIKRGWSKKDALEIKSKGGGYKPCTDHKGNVFNSEKEMCEYWGINNVTFYSRIKVGISLKDALETEIINNFKQSTDHLGNVFNSVAEMCEYWGIPVNTYRTRIRMGWSEKDALETKVKEKLYTDHKGNVFDSVTEMCRYWGVSKTTYRTRIGRGWSKKEALEIKNKRSKQCTDHKGNVFNSEKEMCEFYGIPVHIYRRRIKAGMSLKNALETKVINGRFKPCTDHDGRPFESVIEKCEYYGIPVYVYHSRKRRGWLEEEALGIVPRLPLGSHSNSQVTDNLYIVSCKDINGSIYCNCIYNGNSIILHEDIIRDICRQYNENRILKKGEKYA